MQLKYHIIEELVPENHFLRKLERSVELSFVYEESAHLYSRRYGRPPIDPVVMGKYLLMGFLYGIPSEWQIPPIPTRYRSLSLTRTYNYNKG